MAPSRYRPAFRQLYRTFTAVDVAHERWLAAAGSNGPRYAVLTAISVANRPATPSDIADATGRAPNALSPLIGALEAQGLVKRSRNKADARSHYLRLTSAGTRLAARLDAEEAEFNRRLFTGWARAELDQLTAILATVEAQARTIGRGR